MHRNWPWWYMLACACMFAGFSITPVYAWNYFASLVLYALAGALVWAHVARCPKQVVVNKYELVDYNTDLKEHEQ